jgi:hypothetical protein
MAAILDTRHFDRLCKLEKTGDEIKKISSSLKLQSQSQPIFAEMILGWSSSKIVFGTSEHRPKWPPQPNLSRTARHIFGRESSNDYFIKILFLLSKWFQTRRFLWEFPIGYYVKLS